MLLMVELFWGQQASKSFISVTSHANKSGTESVCMHWTVNLKLK